MFFGAHVVQHVDQQEGVCPGQLRRAQVGVDELDARPPQEALAGRLDLFRIVVHADDPPPLAEHGEHVAQGAVPAPEVYDRRIARHDAVEQLVAPLQPHLDAHVPLQHGALVGVTLDEHVAEIGVARPVVGFVQPEVLPAHQAAGGLGLRRAVCGVGGSHARQHAAYHQPVFDIDGLPFRRDHAVAVEADRQDVQPQFPGQVESPLVEASDLPVCRARPLGEDDHAVPVGHFLRQCRGEAFVSVRRVVEPQVADDTPEYRRTPYPAVGHHHGLGADAQQHQDVDERLVVGDHDRRFFELFARLVQAYGLRRDHRPQEAPRHVVDRPLHDALFAAACHRQRPERENQRL